MLIEICICFRNLSALPLHETWKSEKWNGPTLQESLIRFWIQTNYFYTNWYFYRLIMHLMHLKICKLVQLFFQGLSIQSQFLKTKVYYLIDQQKHWNSSGWITRSRLWMPCISVRDWDHRSQYLRLLNRWVAQFWDLVEWALVSVPLSGYCVGGDQCKEELRPPCAPH